MFLQGPGHPIPANPDIIVSGLGEAMNNVVPFRKLTGRRITSCPVVTAVIDPDAPLRAGDSIAFCWFREDGTPDEVMITRYWGPTGRDALGRFVKAGSPDEEHALDHFNYRPGEDQPFRILGKVVISGWSHDVSVEQSL